MQQAEAVKILYPGIDVSYLFNCVREIFMNRDERHVTNIFIVVNFKISLQIL